MAETEDQGPDSKKSKLAEDGSSGAKQQRLVVTREEWLARRLEHLKKEKALDKERDKLSAERRNLPWVKVDDDNKKYVFVDCDTNQKESLSDLFQSRSQLIVYHFMFGEDWDAGCKSCSFLADHFSSDMLTHLKQRDISFVVISTATPKKLKDFKKRMGWTFKWLSAQDNSFNQDYGVTFSQEDVDNKKVFYNYKKGGFGMTEAPGASVFYKEGGTVYHTYSTYSRGLDRLIGAYHFMDMVPKGRDEKDFPWSMAWLKLHDEYEGAGN